LHDQTTAASNAVEDQNDQRTILVHVIEALPTALRLMDLIREVGNSDDFAKRDAVERAVRDLVKGGLLFRCEDAVLPTRQAVLAYELLGSE
jgi:hypothetical protein